MSVAVPGQPLAERVLSAAAGRPSPPQQFLLHGPRGSGKRRAARALAWALVDPSRPHDPLEESLDIATVAASGTTIRLEDELEPVLASLASRPVVGVRRVMIIDGAERLRPQEGADRILKVLEEPPPLSHVILVTDSITDLIPTIRSRCMLVPFRTPGWQAIRDSLVARGDDPDAARARARADGLLALQVGPFERRLRDLGAGLALAALEGGAGGSALVHDIQSAMEAAADEHPSEELERLRAEAEALEGKRGGKTAAKRADDEARRQRRRLVTEGWQHVLDAMAGVYADALAVAVGAPLSVRDARALPRLQAWVGPERLPEIEAGLGEIQRARAGFRLNPLADLWVEGLLDRLAIARRGAAAPPRSPGALSLS
jgi:DNA polymerase-3 subunit delta'